MWSLKVKMTVEGKFNAVSREKVVLGEDMNSDADLGHFS